MTNEHDWIYLNLCSFSLVLFAKDMSYFRKILISWSNSMFMFKVIFFEQIHLRISHLSGFFHSWNDLTCLFMFLLFNPTALKTSLIHKHQNSIHLSGDSLNSSLSLTTNPDSQWLIFQNSDQVSKCASWNVLVIGLERWGKKSAGSQWNHQCCHQNFCRHVDIADHSRLSGRCAGWTSW